MLRSYLLLAWRSLLRQKAYALVNVAGLAIGVACCLVALVFVRHEVSYDRFHANGDRIFRIVRQGIDEQGVVQRAVVTPAGYAPHLLEDFPEIEAAVRVWSYYGQLRSGDRRLNPEGILFADAAFLQVFSFELLRGDPATALARPFSIVLTASAARVAFGEEDPLGQVILYRGEHELTVTGVVADPPDNSHLDFRYLVPFTALPAVLQRPDALEDYTNYNYRTYLLLPEGYDSAVVEAGFREFLIRRGGEDPGAAACWLQPLREIYLTRGIEFDDGARGDVRYVVAFATVAAFILLMACINFTNLATARFAPRAREVGLRKTLGAQRGQVACQFLGEAMLLSAAAVVLALALAQFALPVVNDLAGRQLRLQVDPPAVASLLGIGLAVALLAGSYPAFYLSGFRPTAALRAARETRLGGAGLRRVLIVLQFAITVALLAGTGIVWRQIRYIRNHDLGFDKEQVVYMWLRDLGSRFDVLREQLLANPQVRGVCQAQSLPGSVDTERGFMWRTDMGTGMRAMAGDPDCIDVLGLRVIHGRGLSREIPSDEEFGYLVNEAAVRRIGWDDPVGQDFWVWDRSPGKVVGVLQDFNYRSLHYEVGPLVFYQQPSWYGMAIAKLRSDDMAETLDFMRGTWNGLSPEQSFNVTFLDDHIDQLYRSEAKLSRSLAGLAGLAMFVGCLGLVGLVSYTVERRTREIGVRKVLGASASSVVRLLLMEFTVLVVAASGVAAPVAYLLMQRWLDDYAYRIDLGATPFLLAGGLTLAVVLLTVGAQALRAARANPVDALRCE